MIIGADHLIITTNNLKQAALGLESKNFECIFKEKNIPNPRAKSKLLQNSPLFHDLWFFRSCDNYLSIELVSYSTQISDSQGPYEHYGHYVGLSTKDVNLEANFWSEVFGFKRKETDILEFKSAFPSWSCTLKLEKKPIKPCTLDGQGYTCLALLTKDIYSTIQQASEHGATDITDIFGLTINKKDLNIVMLRTPTGAICELIQMSG